MLRLSEILLFLAPFGLLALWWLLGTRSKWVVWVALAAVLVLAAGTAWFGLTEGLPRGARYVPARLQNGRIIAGHGA
jgi:hypothetical protein